MRKNISILLLFLIAGFVTNLNAQPVPRDWHMMDYQKDHVYGISIEKAYTELLKNKKSTPVVVAIIDSGIDTLHQDLKGVLWHNPRTKANNPDNDKNSYEGDVFGWNFIGGKDPKNNVTKDTEESLRFYFKYKERFVNVTSENQLKKNDRKLYQDWTRSKAGLLAKTKEGKVIVLINNTLGLCEEFNILFKKEQNKQIYTLTDLNEYKTEDLKLSSHLKSYIKLLKNRKVGTTNIQFAEMLNQKKDSLNKLQRISDTLLVNYRDKIVGDNYNDFNDRFYGNNNIMAGDCMHGTHVAGIIGAVRNNGVGMNGVADNVKLMMIRTIPDGDEHDKDVALAIRYAVDNGAKIINMSFGKAFSPERKWVEKAIRYASRKNVLIVKSAGNDGVNCDSIVFYPTAKYMNSNKIVPNVITVGASGPGTKETGIVAPFSNYGKIMVDVFAPGTSIYSTVPGGNKYKMMDGTSMASPVVTGLAAVLKSYYPHLSAKKIKRIIEESVTKINEPVGKPNSKEKVSMTELCRSGGIVNAYEAIKLAEKMK